MSKRDHSGNNKNFSKNLTNEMLQKLSSTPCQNVQTIAQSQLYTNIRCKPIKIWSCFEFPVCLQNSKF